MERRWATRSRAADKATTKGEAGEQVQAQVGLAKQQCAQGRHSALMQRPYLAAKGARLLRSFEP